MDGEFSPNLIVNQLISEFASGSECYTEITSSYHRLFEENRKIKALIKILSTELNSLRALHADTTYLNKLKQNIDDMEEKQLILQEENDHRNQEVIKLTVDYNDFRDKLNEEQSQKQLLKAKVDSLEDEIRSLKETLEKRDKRIDFLEQDKKNQEATIKLLLEEKAKHETEFNIILMQVKKTNETIVDKMNEVNQLEELVKHKEKTLRTEHEFFEKTKREWEEKRLQFERSAKQNPQSRERGKSSSEEFFSAGFLPRMEDFTSDRKGNEYPKSLTKKLLKFHDNEIYSVAHNINGSVLASCGADRLIKFYDPLNQENLGSIAANYNEKFYTSLKFSNISDILIAGTTENTAEIYNYNTRKLLHKLTGHNAKINDVSFLNDRNKCITASGDRTMKFWDVNKGVVLETINTGSPPKCLDYFNDEPFVVSGHTDGSIRLYSIKDGKLCENIKNLFESDVTCVRISSNNYRILTCSKDGSLVKLYDTRIKKVIMTYTDDSYFNNHEFNKVSFGPDCKTIYAPNGDGSILVWDCDTGKKKETLITDVKSTMISCNFSPITGQLVSADTRGNLFFWC